MADTKTKIYGLIGFPLGHSFSEKYFNQKFVNEGINAEYLNFEIPQIEDFPKILNEQPNLRGLNVTIPYKESVKSYLDEIDAEAGKIGAVNVIKVQCNGIGEIIKLKGYNTDVIGFVDSIKPLLGKEHTKALVLGTGGASKAVCYGLKSLGIHPTLVSRTPRAGSLGYTQLTKEILEENLVIVNATPVGMFPHIDESPEIPYEWITPHHVCYDLIYNPEETAFLRKAKDQGAIIKNGSEMLLGQAIAAWKIWNDN